VNTSELLSLLSAHKGAGKLSRALCGTSVRTIRLSGLCGSAAALLFAAIAAKREDTSLPTLLFVLRDSEEASYFYNDLQQFMPQTDRVLLFPSACRGQGEDCRTDPANMVLRTEVLARLTTLRTQRTTDWPLIVSWPEALGEGVMAQQDFHDRILTMKVGGTADFVTLERQFDELGFHHVDYVYEPGQYAIRGSIIDIYSFNSELPLRIDFFGDEVESIRTFDVQTQLSEQQLGQAIIVPETSRENEETVSPLQFLPPDSVVVTPDMNFVRDRLGDNPSAALLEKLRRVLVLSSTGGVSEVDKATAAGEVSIVFHTMPQPLVHKNFQLLYEELSRWHGEGYRIFILADQAKQTDRLRDILVSMFQTAAYDDVQASDGATTFEPVEHTIHAGFLDYDLKVCLFTDHQIFDRYHKYHLRSDRARRGKAAITLREVQQLQPGDYVVHIDHGIGRFGGLVKVPSPTGGQGYEEMIKITYGQGDILFVSIHSLHKISKYKGADGEEPRLSRLGTGAWERMKQRVKSKVKDLARPLIQLYAKRLHQKGFAYSPDSYMQHELEASFLYEDTPDQLLATQQVKADMEKAVPMDRLICGDVGFGKTEIAVRAAFKAAADNKQTAILVPTTVLAYQHYQTFCDRLKDFPVTVEYLSRARSAADTRNVLKRLAEGSIDIIIGTHKLIGKQVKFHDLGLLIIDEEQKFGVAVKEKLRQVKANVDTLTLTATPIPRTLQFSIMGARDLSVMRTPPPNRYPITTQIHTFDPQFIAEAVDYELSRGGQVFFVNNRVSQLPALESMLRRHLPKVRVCIAHGQMDPKEMEERVMDFMNGDYDVLLSTTIVENGIDIPNANTIIINAAQHYGLSDLHQMRGRVGRSNRQAFCYLIAPPLADLPDDSRRRLQAVENFSELGSGLNIAMQDLDIRGAGNLLGAEQSGFIADLGYETYQKILTEAVDELHQETELEDEAAVDSTATHAAAMPRAKRADLNRALSLSAPPEATLETDIAAYFPDEYVPKDSERIALYRELDAATRPEQLQPYRDRLVDRFGPLPPEAEEFMRVVPLKWTAGRLGIQRVLLKQQICILYLPIDRNDEYYQSDRFLRLIRYATVHARCCQFRQTPGKPSIRIDNVVSIEQALQILQDIENTDTK